MQLDLTTYLKIWRHMWMLPMYILFLRKLELRLTTCVGTFFSFKEIRIETDNMCTFSFSHRKQALIWLKSSYQSYGPNFLSISYGDFQICQSLNVAYYVCNIYFFFWGFYIIQLNWYFEWENSEGELTKPCRLLV